MSNVYAQKANFKQERANTYTPFFGSTGFGKVPQKLGFKPNVQIIKKSNYEQFLKEVSDADFVSLDVETTGLKWTEAELVSINVGLPNNNNYVGFYTHVFFPVDKVDNLVSPVQLDEAVAEILSKPVVFMWNRYYDQRILMYTRGFKEEQFWTCYDALDMLWYLDTNIKSGLGLKNAAQDYLGLPNWGMEEDTWEDIYKADPRTLIVYGSYDAYATLELGTQLYRIHKKHYPFMLQLHIEFKNALFSYQEQHQVLDVPYLEKVSGEVAQALEEVKAQFFEAYGTINMNSHQQKSALLLKLGYSTGVWNKPAKNGDKIMSTSSDLLQTLADKGCEPAKLMIRHSKLEKLQSSYLTPMLESGKSGNPVRFYFKDHDVNTLRLSAGKYTVKRKTYDYFLPISMQTLPKPSKALRELNYDPKTFEIAWPEGRGQYYVETGSPNLNMRKAFCANSDGLVIKADFSQQELCLVEKRTTVVVKDHGKMNIGWLRGNIGAKILVDGKLKDKKEKLWGTVTAFYDTGEKEICRLVLKSGRMLECSRNHLVKVFNGQHYVWKRFDELTLGDLVQEGGFSSRDAYDSVSLDSKSIRFWDFQKKYEAVRSYVVGGSQGFIDFTGEKSLSVRNSLGVCSFEVKRERELFLMERLRKEDRLSIWSRDIAYFLGYFFGDGNLTKTGDVVSISSIDEQIIQGFARLFPNSKVETVHYDEDFRASRGMKKIPKAAYWWIVRSKSFWQSLYSLGLRPNKSVVGCCMPDIPKDLRWDFIRGLIDSDGSVYDWGNGSYCVSFVGHVSYMKVVVGWLREVFGGSVHYEESETLCSIQILGRSVMVRLFFLCFGFFLRPNLYLHRKWDKVIPWVERLYSESNIAALTFTGKMSPMVDITIDVPRTKSHLAHSFLANGIRVHNCIPAVLANETTWLDAIKNGEDLHRATGRSVYGREVTSTERQLMKGLNFGIMYETENPEYVIANQTGWPIEQAREFFAKYKAALPRLYAWKEKVMLEGRTTGGIKNLYGFERRVYSYYHTADRKMHRFGDRTCVNTSVQGLAAIMMRILMVKFWKLLYLPKGKYSNKGISFFNTAHDEMVFRVDDLSILPEFLPDFKDTMASVTPSDWPVKLGVEVEIGKNYGETFLVYQTDQGLWVPKEEKRDEDKPAVFVDNVNAAMVDEWIENTNEELEGFTFG